MFELTISISQDKQLHIHALYLKLAKEVKADGGVIAEHNHENRASLAIAVPKNKREYYKSKIADYIVFIIIDEYKFNFYKNNLYPMGEGILCQAFLKAISIFDAEIDCEIIKEQLVFSSEILIDSFYFFKLQNLTARWERTANIINENHILSSETAMIEVLKYLTISSENLSVSAEVLFSKKQIKLKGLTLGKCFKRDTQGYSNFFTELVRLNPVKINLKFSAGVKKDFVSDLLLKIFSEKVYFLN